MQVAESKGLPQLKYHLLPRTKGFWVTVQNLRGTGEFPSLMKSLNMGVDVFFLFLLFFPSVFSAFTWFIFFVFIGLNTFLQLPLSILHLHCLTKHFGNPVLKMSLLLFERGKSYSYLLAVYLVTCSHGCVWFHTELQGQRGADLARNSEREEISRGFIREVQRGGLKWEFPV